MNENYDGCANLTEVFATLATKFLDHSNLHSSPQRQFFGYSVVEHRFRAPLDFTGQYFDAFNLNQDERAQLPAEITVFAREYIADGGENRPRLVSFQGGPGSAGTRPAPMGGWMQAMLAHYRIVMLDERGTGQSHAMDSLRISNIADARVQAAYLACFRADHIVADAELLRRLLQDLEKWSTLGQSFGGFCITSYLSLAPDGLAQAFITAGLPSTFRHADEVYKRTWASLETRNAEYFATFPEDEVTCWEIVEHLATHEEFLPTGERLTPRRFRMLGIALGWSFGFEKLHYLLEDPFVDVARGEVKIASGANDSFPAMHQGDTADKESSVVLGVEVAADTLTSAGNNANRDPETCTSTASRARREPNRERRLSSRFLSAVGNELSFGATPLYWTLHESIYAQKQARRDSSLSGETSSAPAATAWSAQRVRESLPQFHVPNLTDGVQGERELRQWAHANGFGFRFSCEHVFPWQGEEDPALRGLAAATEYLAYFDQFPSLHNPTALAKNTVPVKAWIYEPDMFVPFELSMETAEQIRGLEPLISHTFHHDALRTHSDEIVSAFIAD